MNKLQYSENKTLKLTNVLKYKILLDNENFNLDVVIEQMKSYIKARDALPKGPLIQYSEVSFNENNELNMEIIMMLQCNQFIYNVEPPYVMESIIRVPNALYCRYTGPEDCLSFAYDKINIAAFEKEIKIANYNYTVFLDTNPEENSIIADVFVPREESK